MTIVESVARKEKLQGGVEKYQRSTITLRLEERQKTHGRRSSDDGVEFGISLDPGITLTNGDCLVLEEERVIVIVREAAEAVYVVQPLSSGEWAYFSYQIGNRHQKLMITDDELVCLRDPSVRSLFEQLHIDYKEDMRPFTPANVLLSHHNH